MPSVLAAVKRAVDDDPRPGRFLLTGSVEADLVAQIWPGTGRVVRVVLRGMNRREITGDIGRDGILQRLRSGTVGDLPSPSTVPDIDGYIDLALVSGFPEAALRLSPRIRETWLDAYLSNVVTRDVQAFGEFRDPVRLRRYLDRPGHHLPGR